MHDVIRSGSTMARDLAAVIAYHRLSSLDPEQPGAMPERLERRSQPIPFRHYIGAPRQLLTLPDCSQGCAEPALESIGRVLESSLALAGWKRHANAGFGLRKVPSAGNLHPLESYVVASGLEAGANDVAALYHYSPFDHALERRRCLPTTVWQSLRASSPGATAFFALSAIYWRNAWKYGERGFRLCQLDAGHAVAALDASTALEGLSVRFLDADHQALVRLLGCGEIENPEAEDPLCLLAVEPPGQKATLQSWCPDLAVLHEMDQARLVGEPSRVSERHRSWPGLLSVARATRRVQRSITDSDHGGLGSPSVESHIPRSQAAAWPRDILHRRRSRSLLIERAVGRQSFHELIDRLVGENAASTFPWRHDIAVLLFVHRVDGVEPGLYAALTNDAGGDQSLIELRASLGPDFDWHDVSRQDSLQTWDQTSDLNMSNAQGWRLIRLSRGDARRAATHLSGGQPAAGDGAFAALFLGHFEALHRDGPWAYRRLHWQAGELGHRLYLEAEAKRLGATGLGGFFDDRLCTLLGLDTARTDTWHPLYMVAVGHRGGDDPELNPPYAHRGSNAEPAPASRGGLIWPD